MNIDFPRIITLLRKEKKLSQKQVAEDLSISQALLSHYEKGIRECGLDFVVKIADYYNVSCDYLLGRTPQRYSDITDMSDDISENKKLTVSQIVNKKLINNSISLIYEYLIQTGNRKAANLVSSYLMLSTYRVFRTLYSINENNPEDMFAIPKGLYSKYSDATMQMFSANIEAGLLNTKNDEKSSNMFAPQMSPELIASQYPKLASSVFNVIVHAENDIKRYIK